MRFENIEKVLFSNVKFVQENGKDINDISVIAPRVEFVNSKLSGTLKLTEI